MLSPCARLKMIPTAFFCCLQFARHSYTKLRRRPLRFGWPLAVAIASVLTVIALVLWYSQQPLPLWILLTGVPPHRGCMATVTQATRLELATTAAVSLAKRQQVVHSDLPRCCCVGDGEDALCWPPPSTVGGRPYTILFHSNHLGWRGTEVALYDYASALEENACGRSLVAYWDGEEAPARAKFEARFPGRVHALPRDADLQGRLDALVASEGIDAVYTIQSGERKGGRPPPRPAHAPLLVHAVFNGREPHGDGYATISETVPRSSGVQVVPHIAMLNVSDEDAPSMRAELGIPSSATVFCRHGGHEQMNIPWARTAVCEHARAMGPAVYFLFMFTARAPCEEGLANIVHLPPTADLRAKRRFLNTCTACLHARPDGETFGLAVAECSLAGLPVITHGGLQPAFHLSVLGKEAVTYWDASSLRSSLAAVNAEAAAACAPLYRRLYAQFSPAPVLRRFLVGFGVLDALLLKENPAAVPWVGRCVPPTSS